MDETVNIPSLVYGSDGVTHRKLSERSHGLERFAHGSGGKVNPPAQLSGAEEMKSSDGFNSGMSGA